MIISSKQSQRIIIHDVHLELGNDSNAKAMQLTEKFHEGFDGIT